MICITTEKLREAMVYARELERLNWAIPTVSDQVFVPEDMDVHVIVPSSLIREQLEERKNQLIGELFLLGIKIQDGDYDERSLQIGPQKASG